MEKIKVLLEQLARRFSCTDRAEQWFVDDCWKDAVTCFLRYLLACTDVGISDRAEQAYTHTFFLTPIMCYRYSNKNYFCMEEIRREWSNLS